MPSTKQAVALAVNIFIAVAVAVAWAMMAFGDGVEGLAARGLWSLKFFTVLSNLLLGFSSLLYAICLVRCRRGAASQMPRPVHVLKYVATSAVGLTFATVMGFLGPVFGFETMFTGANLWFHLVIPVAALLEFCIFDDAHELHLRDNLLAMLPTAIYGLGYVANILVNGVGQGPTSNDWYGFAIWGLDKMPVVFAIMAAVAFLLALVIRLANARIALRGRPAR